MRILINTWGSLGDLYPFLNLAQGLTQRGHSVTVATSEYYRNRVMASDIDFCAIPPDIRALFEDSEEALSVVGAEAPEREIWKILGDHLLDSYIALREASQGVDFIVASDGALAAPAVAESLGIPWLSSILQPCRLKVLPDNALSSRQYPEEAFATRLLNDLRTKAGLGGAARDTRFSPYGTLGLFSKTLLHDGDRRSPSLDITGFPFAVGRKECSERTLKFALSGDPPVLFTLGSFLGREDRAFAIQSARAVSLAGLRGVILEGGARSEIDCEDDEERVLVADQKDFSGLLPHCKAVVCHAGIGTIAETLKWGLPILLVPKVFDQPDNARRVAAMKCGRVLPWGQYSSTTVAQHLTGMLSDQEIRNSLRRVQAVLGAEDGVDTASSIVERRARKLCMSWDLTTDSTT